MNPVQDRRSPVEIRLLGPVEVLVGERRLDVGPPQQRLMLAVLAVHVGRLVTVPALIDQIWDYAPPGARRTLHVLITRLRRLLEQAHATGGEGTDPGQTGADPGQTGTGSGKARTGSRWLAHRSGGYVLELEPDQVDLHRFDRLVREANTADLPQRERADRLRAALALCRGEPLAGLEGQSPARIRDMLHRRHLEATVAWARAELPEGNAAATVGPLADLAAAYPLDEPVAGTLMLALHAAGRPADALEQYTKVRNTLVEQLGTDPGADLQALHRSLLRGDLDPPAANDPVRNPDPPAANDPVRNPQEAGPEQERAQPAPVVPALLPRDVFGFAGRDLEVARLDAVLARGDDQPTAAIISTLSGAPGVGKTALAVHWAHRVAGQFPDGQLYVNLRGFDPSGSAMSPAEAVRGFLEAMLVSPRLLPASLDAQVALYRSLLAGRRMLVVLDNARDAEQVRPLLPGSPTALALITSRDQLPSLVANDGAHPIAVDLLSNADAGRLLERRLGTERVAAEPVAVDEIVALCAGLPLALSFVAARAAIHPHFPLAALAGEIRETRSGLDAFDGGDPTTDARAVFSWSYRTLSAAAAALFRRLALQPGPDIAPRAVASMTGCSVAEIRAPLAELARAHLIEERAPGRYTFHDLLRAYATELVHKADPETSRRATVHRILDHYLHTAYAADLQLDPHRDSIVPAPPRPGVTPEAFADLNQALAWFTAEHATLVEAVGYAARTGFDTHALQLAWALATYLDNGGHWHDWIATQRTALAIAERHGDRHGQARSHRGLGIAYTRMGRYRDGRRQHQLSLDLCVELDDVVGQAYAHRNLAVVYSLQGSYTEAIQHGHQCVELHRINGERTSRAGEARALNAIGWYCAQVGRYEEALLHCERAIAMQEEIGDRYGAPDTWDSLGFAHHHLGNYPRAIACYERALELVRETGDRYSEATTMTRLGDSYREVRRREAAVVTWRQALSILDELGHPAAGDVRIKLRHLDPAMSAGQS